MINIQLRSHVFFVFSRLYLLPLRKISLLFFSFYIFSPVFALSLEDIYQDLKLHYPQYEGITYDAPSWNNTLEDNTWLLQTPNIWGNPLSFYNAGFQPKNGQVIDKEMFVPTCETQIDCSGTSLCKLVTYISSPRKLCVTKAHDVLEQMYLTIISANESVDIATLGPIEIKGNAFKSVLKHAFHRLALKSIQSKQTIIVRYLEGSFLPFDYFAVRIWMNELLDSLPPHHRLAISIANMRSCVLKFNCGNLSDQSALVFAFSWNHAKILNVDNKILITGGQNFFGTDYLQSNPVNDVNIKIQGVVAQGATNYMNRLWDYVDKNQGYFSNFCRTYYYANQSNTCMTETQMEIYLWPRKLSAPRVQEEGSYKFVNAMYISKLDNGVGVGDDADQSEIARVYAIKNAQKSIKVSQQGLYMARRNPFVENNRLHPMKSIDGDLIYALAYAMHMNAVHVYIVQGPYDKSGTTSYTATVDLHYIYDCLLETMKQEFNLSNNAATREINRYLHLGTLNYSHSSSTVPQKPMAFAHNKFWMVDDKIFYFGSHNFYPSMQQEFGVIVEATEDISHNLLETFWNPMWEHSLKF